MKILGIDFGLSKIGLAISDGGMITPLMVIVNSAMAVPKIAEICEKNQIETMVIGLPERELGEKVKQFIGQLFLQTKIPFEFQDETLTSRQALAKMIETKKRKKIRQKREDAFAAACILQEYLEERRRNV